MTYTEKLNLLIDSYQAELLTANKDRKEAITLMLFVLRNDAPEEEELDELLLRFAN